MAPTRFETINGKITTHYLKVKKRKARLKKERRLKRLM